MGSVSCLMGLEILLWINVDCGFETSCSFSFKTNILGELGLFCS